MDILHWKRTTIAEAPDELSNCINRFSSHNSYVVKNQDIRNKSPDVVHYHNKESRCPDSPKKVIQYHSEPHRVDQSFNQKMNKKLVIAQYHATLPEYQDCELVRNIINFRKDLYEPKKITDKVKVGFSPSATTNNGYWYNKGYRQTKRILERLKKLYPEKFDFDIISGAPLDECIQRKSECNVIIDECCSSSYHRSGLEGLALGKLSICSLSDEVKDVLKRVSGSDEIPFFDVELKKLYHFLKEIIEGEIDYVIQKGRESREWMKNNWSPEETVNDFIKIYESV